MFTVRIYLTQRGVDVFRWLCARCLFALEAEGWVGRQSKDPPPQNPTLACDGDACLAVRGMAAA